MWQHIRPIPKGFICYYSLTFSYEVKRKQYGRNKYSKSYRFRLDLFLKHYYLFAGQLCEIYNSWNWTAWNIYDKYFGSNGKHPIPFGEFFHYDNKRGRKLFSNVEGEKCYVGSIALKQLHRLHSSKLSTPCCHNHTRWTASLQDGEGVLKLNLKETFHLPQFENMIFVPRTKMTKYWTQPL